jgi:hypothetical protein
VWYRESICPLRVKKKKKKKKLGWKISSIVRYVTRLLAFPTPHTTLAF